PRGAGIVARSAGFKTPRRGDEIVIAHRRCTRSLKIVAPPTGRILNIEIACQGRIQLRDGIAADVQESTAEGRIQPFVPPAGENVYGRFLHVDGNRSDLLDGINKQPNSALAAQSAERAQVEPIPVRPLNGTDGNDSRARLDACGE